MEVIVVKFRLQIRWQKIAAQSGHRFIDPSVVGCTVDPKVLVGVNVDGLHEYPIVAQVLMEGSSFRQWLEPQHKDGRRGWCIILQRFAVFGTGVAGSRPP